MAKTLFTTRQIEQVGKKEFAIAALDPDNKIFIVYITSLVSFGLYVEINAFQHAQIAFLKADEAHTFVPSKYTDVFSKNLAAKLPKSTKINNYTIDLVKS